RVFALALGSPAYLYCRDHRNQLAHTRRTAAEQGLAMQLKLQRSQRAGGLTGSTIHFCLDVRADYTAEERGNINKYGLGAQVIYNSRAARQHLDAAGVHLDRTQEGSVGNRLVGLA